MMEILTIIVLCEALFGIGVVVGSKTSVNKPKTFRTLDKMDDRELVLLFMAVGSELETRGMVERVDNSPFEEFKKK